jgi:hypothetical protein
MWNSDHIARSGSPRGRIDKAPAVGRENTISTIERIPRDRCMVCDEVVEFLTDGNGRLVAYDAYPRAVHRHPEAVIGEGTYRRQHNLPDGADREPSPDEIREILTSELSASQIARQLMINYEIVTGVLSGKLHRQDGVNYEEIRARRAGRRGRVSASNQDPVMLSDDEVRDIVYTGESNRRLCQRYNISITMLHQIRQGMRNHLDDIDYEEAKAVREAKRRVGREIGTGRYQRSEP